MDPFDHERLYGPLYSDVGYFVRGRPGIHPDPAAPFPWRVVAVIVATPLGIVALAAFMHALLPTVR